MGGDTDWYALTSPANPNTYNWNAVVLSRNAIYFRIFRNCTQKVEVAPKLTLLLNAINLLIARNFTGGSLNCTFRILVAEVLPHCEASKTQLRILQKLFRDTFDSITSFVLAMQLAQSSLSTLIPVPALAANNGNIPSSEQSGAATLLHKQNFDSESNSGLMQASADRVNKFDRTKATTRTVTCGRYNLRIPSTWFPVDLDSDSEDQFPTTC
jgi:hypothetical protein